MRESIKEKFRQKHQDVITSYALLKIRIRALPSTSLLALPLEQSLNQVGLHLYTPDRKIPKAVIDEIVEEEIIHISS